MNWRPLIYTFCSCPRLLSRRTLADRFVITIWRLAVLWENDYDLVCLLPNIQVLHKHVSLVQEWLQGIVFDLLTIPKQVKSDRINTWRPNPLFLYWWCYGCVSKGDISSWDWHRYCSRLLCCWESDQLLPKHQVGKQKKDLLLLLLLLLLNWFPPKPAGRMVCNSGKLLACSDLS